jgi:hypothetical protein
VLPALAAAVGAAHRILPVLEAVVRLRRSSPQVLSSILRASANRPVLLHSPCIYSNRYPFAFSFNTRRWSGRTSVAPCTSSCSICVALSNSGGPPFADAFPSAAPSVPLFGKPARNTRDCSHRDTGLLQEVAPMWQWARSKRSSAYWPAQYRDLWPNSPKKPIRSLTIEFGYNVCSASFASDRLAGCPSRKDANRRKPTAIAEDPLIPTDKIPPVQASEPHSRLRQATTLWETTGGLRGPYQ